MNILCNQQRIYSMLRDYKLIDLVCTVTAFIVIIILVQCVHYCSVAKYNTWCLQVYEECQELGLFPLLGSVCDRSNLMWWISFSGLSNGIHNIIIREWTLN